MVCYLWAVRVSGGHFNPATTFAVFIRNKDKKDANAKYAWIVMITQLVGAFVGVLFVFLALKDYRAPFSQELAEFSPSNFFSDIIPDQKMGGGLGRVMGNITHFQNLAVYPRESINTTLYFYQTPDEFR